MSLDDLPTRFADALESAAARVRALTTDRVEHWIRLLLLTVVVVVIASLGSVFVLVAFHRVLAIWLGPAGALAVLGGLSAVAGVLTWNRGSVRSRGDS